MLLKNTEDLNDYDNYHLIDAFDTSGDTLGLELYFRDILKGKKTELRCMKSQAQQQQENHHEEHDNYTRLSNDEPTSSTSEAAPAGNSSTTTARFSSSSAVSFTPTAPRSFIHAVPTCLIRAGLVNQQRSNAPKLDLRV
jgi:Tfp pilus assembly protein PilE